MKILLVSSFHGFLARFWKKLHLRKTSKNTKTGWIPRVFCMERMKYNPTYPRMSLFLQEIINFTSFKIKGMPPQPTNQWAQRRKIWVRLLVEMREWAPCVRALATLFWRHQDTVFPDQWVDRKPPPNFREEIESCWHRKRLWQHQDSWHCGMSQV